MALAAAKTERLLNLTIALLATRRPLRKAQIRDAVPQYADCAGDTAFDRMFERDKDELRAIGIPLVVSTIDDWSEIENAYRIDAEAYALPEVPLTPAELGVLGLAARMWDQAGVRDASARALVKLRALGIDAVAVTGIEPTVQATEPGFEALYRATRDECPVSFRYRSAGGGADVARTVEPWTLALRRGVWYLAGHDRDRGAPRVFRLSRMAGPWRRAGDPGDMRRPSPAELATCLASLDGPWERRPEQGTATVRITVGAAARLRRMAGEQFAAEAVATGSKAGTRYADTITVPFADVESLASLIAGYAGDVFVIGPPEVREAVLRRWRNALAAHTGQPNPSAAAHAPVADSPSGTPASAKALRPAPAAADRLSRLLALVPYLLQRPGIPIDEAAAHFGVSQTQLVDDLQLLFVCGTPGHLPDDLIEADWSGGVVRIGNADAIARPLRLTGDEAVALLVGLEILAGIPGPHDRTAISGARRAIAAASRSPAEPAAVATPLVPVTFVGTTDGPVASVTSAVVASLQTGSRLRLRYHSASRDQVTDREVDPTRLMHSEGWDYLEGWCHTAGDTRMFRLDRILAAEVLDQPALTVATTARRSAVPAPRHDDVAVTVTLAPDARWVADYLHAPVQPLPGVSDETAFSAVLTMADTARIERWALAGDGRIEVVGPSAVRARIAERAAAALARHAADPAGA